VLARYHIVRGKRSPDDPLPKGHRMDTRKHTRSILRPEAENVIALLADPTPENFRVYAQAYERLLEQRFSDDRRAFDELAYEARIADVFIGCNCPTEKNPDVNHCHTVLALRFMKRKYPELEVVFPAGVSPS
jgi:hypothetical protein